MITSVYNYKIYKNLDVDIHVAMIRGTHMVN